MSDFFVSAIDPRDRRAQQQMDDLLRQEGIRRDANLDYSCGLYTEDYEMAGTGSCFGSTLRCLAVSRDHQGEGLMNQIVGNVDVLINATPVGMYPNVDDIPIVPCAVGRCAAVYDAIYNPLETALVKRAKANGSKAVGGMSMLVWQAAVAQEIWHGKSFDEKDIDKLCIEASKELLNR